MPTSKLPGIRELEQMRRRGMTDQQIADWVKENTGQEVSRQAVATAFWRAGKTRQNERYDTTLPWKIAPEHAQDGRARVLRWLGRRLAGLPLTEDQEQRVDSMLAKLERDDKVIVYLDPDMSDKPGFHAVPRKQALEDYGGRQPDESVPIAILPGNVLRT